jgi:hypothetical protein
LGHAKYLFSAAKRRRDFVAKPESPALEPLDARLRLMIGTDNATPYDTNRPSTLIA